MNRWRRWFGLHPVEMLIHFAVGGLLIVAVGDAAKHDVFPLLTSAGVLGAYAWRRQRAVAALPPVTSNSGEVRAAELEAQADEIHDLHMRLAELEERVDFAERLLAKQADTAALGR